MTTTPTSGAADLPEALRSIQRFEVVDCIDDKHVPAVIPKPHGPWVRYEDHIAALAAGQATTAQQPGAAYAALPDEREAFEAWYIAQVRSKTSTTNDWSDDEIRGAWLSRPSDAYRSSFAGQSWEAWQARASYGQAPAQAAPAAVAGSSEFPHEKMDAVALGRYKVVSSDQSMFYRFAVVAGDGAQQLYIGREVDCQNMARKFAGAFLDGAFAYHSMTAAPTAQPAPQQEAQKPFAWHVCSVNSDGSLSLEHAAAWEEAAHEHINDAITEHDIEGAGSWVVRPAYHAPQPSPTAQAEDSVQEDAARYRWLREGNDAKHGAAWHVAVNLYGCEWDAAIDAAMNKGATP